tara:strand:+ start:161 stop:496 length:336 start_codon:yes stop_codon:yes gene_type:complete
MNKTKKPEESTAFYQQVYSVSMDDLVDIWIESFHPYGTVLVIFDCGKYFNLLQDCGILCSQLNAYNNKILTIALNGVDKAIEILDIIEKQGYHPIMYVYDNGKMILDNIEP